LAYSTFVSALVYTRAVLCLIGSSRTNILSILVYSKFVSDLLYTRVVLCLIGSSGRTSCLSWHTLTNVEYAKIDRMLFLDDPIKERTTLVYKRSETNVEYTKIDRMFDPVYLGILYIRLRPCIY
jgi:hypothetical protein